MIATTPSRLGSRAAVAKPRANKSLTRAAAAMLKPIEISSQNLSPRNAYVEPVSAPLSPPVAAQHAFTTLLDETQQGMLVVSDQCRVVYANLAVSMMFPCRAVREGDDLKQRCIADLRALIVKALESRTRVHGEIRIRQQEAAQADAEHSYRVTAAPLPEGGAWCILDDITEHVFTEQVRKDFVSNASHELRTPLSLIHGYIETLQSGVIKAGPSMQRCLEVMHKHSRRMMRIIEDMLTIARLERDDAQLLMEPFNVRACVADVLEQLTPLIELRQPRLTLDFPSDGGTLHGDRFYWEQIFTNLIENALKENAQQGLQLSLAGHWNERGCTLTISDNGIGISAADLPFVFKRFYRSSDHHDRGTKGTGLGLSIVKRAIEAHGGTIDLSSAPGVATTFTIKVPTDEVAR
jgi:signal transduction histidine kinase